MSAAVTIPTTMRALVQDCYGEADTLRVDDAPIPAPGPKQVLVRVRAASVNPADVFTMRGVPRVLRLGSGLVRPHKRVRGMDLAGEVVAVGAKVTRWRAGDRVFGQGEGTLAQYAVARQGQLAAVPQGVSLEHAASVAVAGITAQIAVERASLTPGQWMLINGAGGGIGQFAVQLARNAGAHVTAVCSSRSAEAVRDLGADVVLDYTVDDVLSPAHLYDAVLDNAGSIGIPDWRRITTRKGVIFPNSGAPGPDGGPLRRVFRAALHNLVASQRILTFVATVTTERLERFGADLASGAVTPYIGATFPLEQAPEAMALVASHHAPGKVIVTIA
jgi:NADPH:quinone reductase-like Zn-dependent oxidoreductase